MGAGHTPTCYCAAVRSSCCLVIVTVVRVVNFPSFGVVILYGVLVGSLRCRELLARGLDACVVEIPKELLHAHGPEICMPEEILLHLVQVILLVRVAQDILTMIIASRNTLLVGYNELRVQIPRSFCAADHMETEHTVMA